MHKPVRTGSIIPELIFHLSIHKKLFLGTRRPGGGKQHLLSLRVINGLIFVTMCRLIWGKLLPTTPTLKHLQLKHPLLCGTTNPVQGECEVRTASFPFSGAASHHKAAGQTSPWTPNPLSWLSSRPRIFLLSSPLPSWPLSPLFPLLCAAG